MKLLYVLHQFFPRHITGTEQYVLGLAREAMRRGHEVRVFTLEPDFLIGWPGVRSWADRYEELPVHRVSLGNEILANPVLAEYESPLVERIFEELLDAWPPDVMHVFHLRYLGAGLLDVAAARRLPVVSHLMDFWYLCPRFTLLDSAGGLCEGPATPEADCLGCAYPGLQQLLTRAGVDGREVVPPYRREILRHTDLFGDLITAAVRREDRMREAFGLSQVVVAPSVFLKEMFAANRFDDRRVRVIPYGVDMARLGGLDRDSPRDASGRGMVIGFIGTIAQHKGLHVLIEAFGRLRDPAVRLKIHGRQEDYPDYSADRRHQAGSDARISFEGAFAPADLGRVLGGLDLLVVPSLWYENTPFVALEALAAGVPVVASRLGGLTETFDEGRSGRSFRAGDATELAGILEWLASRPERLAAMRAAIPQARTLQDSLDDLEEVYGEIMNADRESRSSARVGGEEDGDGRDENRSIVRLLELRERQVKDLYDQLMTLAARWVREKEGEAEGGE